jgi:MFS family permease
MKPRVNQTIWGFALASFFGDFGYEMANVLLPLLAVIISGSQAPATLGLAVGLAAGISGLTRIVFGLLSDRLSEKRILIALGYGITAFSNALLGFVTQPIQMIWSQIGSWSGSAIREPARDALLSAVGGSTSLVRAFSIDRAMDTLGALVGPLCAFVLIKYLSVRTLLFFTLIPGLCAAAIVVLMVAVVPNTPMSIRRFSVRDIVGLPTEFKTFLLVMLLFGIANFSKTFLVLRVAQAFGYQSHLVVASGFAIGVYIFFNIVRAITELSLTLFSRLLSKKWWLILAFGSFITGSLLLIVAANIYLIWGIIIILVGLSAGIISVMQRVYAADYLPEHMRATGYAMLAMVNNISGLISSIIVGVLWAYVGAPIAFLYAASMAALALIFFGR